MFQMRNKKNTWLKLIMLLIIYPFIFSAVSAKGEDEKAPYFTNKDIEAYREPYDGRTTDIKIDKAEDKKEALREKKEQKEQGYWCRKASQYDRKIERAQDEVKEIN